MLFQQTKRTDELLVLTFRYDTPPQSLRAHCLQANISLSIQTVGDNEVYGHWTKIWCCDNNADGVSGKSLRQKFLFSREEPLVARGKYYILRQ